MPENIRLDARRLTFRPVTAENRAEAVATVALGMADNPLHVAAYGPVAHIRIVRHRRLVERSVRPDAAPGAGCGLPWHTTGGRRVIGTCGSLPTYVRTAAALRSTACNGRARVFATRLVVAEGGGSPRLPPASRARRPLAVHSRYQGRGVGSALLSRLCQTLDVTGSVAYLETDKAENLRFYRRLGFEVVGEAEVIGVPNWFMSRSPHES